MEAGCRPVAWCGAAGAAVRIRGGPGVPGLFHGRAGEGAGVPARVLRQPPGGPAALPGQQSADSAHSDGASWDYLLPGATLGRAGRGKRSPKGQGTSLLPPFLQPFSPVGVCVFTSLVVPRFTCFPT